jgi:uncharacterized protein (TIGR03083 family)
MDQHDYHAALRRDGEGFAAACAAAPLDAEVPSCPGWSVADLLWHLTEVHDFWCTIVAGRLESPDGYEQPARPAAADLLEMYEAGLDRLAGELTAADPVTEVWTWSADRTVGFVQRRMAQETAVHRWDAETVAGQPAPIDAELASDGIDEFLVHFLARAANGAAPVDGTVHLHCTDVAGEWLVVPDGEGLAVTREHAKGDCALRGPASDLLLVLWRRLPLDALEVIGDSGVATRFVGHTGTE